METRRISAKWNYPCNTSLPCPAVISLTRLCEGPQIRLRLTYNRQQLAWPHFGEIEKIFLMKKPSSGWGYNEDWSSFIPHKCQHSLGDSYILYVYIQSTLHPQLCKCLMLFQTSQHSVSSNQMGCNISI